MGPGIAVDPVDGTLATAFVQRARARWPLEVTEALVLLVTLAGWTSAYEAGRALALAEQTVRNARTRVRQALDAATWDQATVRAWAVYGPLRAELATRRRAGTED